MGYIRGSHRWIDENTGKPGVVFRAKNLITEQKDQPLSAIMPEHQPELPDIESNEADYDIIYYDAQPGDVSECEHVISNKPSETCTPQQCLFDSFRRLRYMPTHAGDCASR